MLRVALEVVYSTQDIWQGLPYVLITLAVFVGGLILWCGLFWLLEYGLLRRERRGRVWLVHRDDGGRGSEYRERPQRTCSNMTHLTLQSLFFGGIAVIIWISCATAGFNPWTTAAASLAISVVATYTFASTLGQLGSGFTVLATNTVAVDQYWEFLGMPGYDGRIVAIYAMEVEMERFDEQTKCAEIISVPINTFLSTPRKRNLHKEFHARSVSRDPAECFTAPPSSLPPPTTTIVHAQAPAAARTTRPLALPFLPAVTTGMSVGRNKLHDV